MHGVESAPERPPKGVRTPAEGIVHGLSHRCDGVAQVVASSECLDRCEVCHEPMRQRKGKRVCSPACRRERSRQRKAAVRDAHIQEIRELLIAAEERVQAARCHLTSLERR